MSALQITRKKGDARFCANRCKGPNGLAAASDYIQILGYPQGWFCPKCAKGMRDAYQNALTGWEFGETEERQVLRSAA